MRFRLVTCVFIGLLVLGNNSSPAATDDARIAGLKAYAQDGELRLSLRLDHCFTPKMLDAIKSGVATTFKILIVLEKPGLPLFRTKLLDTHLEHSLKYDQLTDEYHLTLAEHPNRSLTTSDFSEARRLMSQVRDIPILPLWRLDRNELYKLRIKAELSKVRLPMPLRYLFFFVSLWDFETDWQVVDFQY